jgi:hypothetical protein
MAGAVGAFSLDRDRDAIVELCFVQRSIGGD